MINSKAYLEDYHYIKLLVHEGDMPLVDCDNLYVSNEDDNIKLVVYKVEQFGEYFHINTTFKGRILLHKDYFINLKENARIQLFLGQIMRTERFDVENYYDEKSKICDFYITLFEECADGRYNRHEETQSEKMYTLSEMKNALEKTGMEFLYAFGDFDFSPGSDECERIYIVAKCRK